MRSRRSDMGRGPVIRRWAVIWMVLSAFFCSATAALSVEHRGAMEVVWSQPPDDSGSKISAESIPALSLDSEVASDFMYPTDVTVTKVSWWGGPYRAAGGPEPTSFSVLFYDDDSCKPGTLVHAYYGIDPVITPAGTDRLGFAIHRYDAYVLFDATGGQVYWMSIQAASHDSPPQWGRQQAADSLGCPGMVRCSYFGDQDWTRCSTLAHRPWDASEQIEIHTPTIEACCLADGFCQMVLADSCTAAGGTPQGAGTNCDTVVCPESGQACCAQGGECTIEPALTCVLGGGIPQGAGTVCTPNPCGVDEACCLSDGSCMMVSAQTCTMFGGTAQGPGTDCATTSCPAGQACCFSDGTCGLIVPDRCTQFGGTPHGEGSTCQPDNPCPQPPAEACCFTDGHCLSLVPLQCSIQGGTPQGASTTCSPNPCPQPQQQSCCFSDGHCTMEFDSACMTAGGNPGGAGTTCDPNVCPVAIRVRTATWGSIKATFR